ncbi:GSCOCG00007374001-RA-CDS [Cotesia congregata]|uniref:Checkpoint protein n=1 Tax=Cotesia congregata TaxID=51543 RepID=A0A8J2MF77_COTCN|nr:GSCOCG00007374001-RA-CDS [Cotesia congregata]CAG5088525.1 Similar to HUS1: Checkpoint protein HUS1 (Homo sapiens) [Cotesia congregata]
MRFRCKMIDAVAMRDFTNIVTAISKTSKHCVLELTNDQICFTVLDDSGRAPTVWVELSRYHFFNEYVMVGIGENNNKILFDFDAQMLAKSLMSLRATARSVKMKLTNKQHPCLTLEIELPSLTTDSWQCIHDVPIKILPRQEWNVYQPPTIPDFHISIDLPQLKYIRSFVERMKNMSPHLRLIVNNDGLLVLKVETDAASVATHFQNLQVWKADESERDSVTAAVDIRRFFTIHTWDAIHPDSVKCNIINERLVYIHINLDDNIKVHHFIPAVAID